MQYGFVIDNRSCIGCHACTVACKAENLVPIGVNRTWVKYVERGEYPNVSRSFQVNRCNHCKDAPCVTICPTHSLFTREDGIVDFDDRRCIGCKSCTQACPYDAIYIDPDTNTAAKCNFCAHRIDQGLNPSCVNVCPTQAIHFGDLSDPDSDVSQLVARERVSVRKPEKGTIPALYYIEGDHAQLDPAATAPSSPTVWSDQARGVGHNFGLDGQQFDLLQIVERARATQSGSSETLDGLLRDMEGATGSEKVRRAYDAPDKGIQWGWEVAAYIFTKALAAGLMLVSALAFILPQVGLISSALSPADSAYQFWLPLLSLVALAATGALLVKDLDRPERFLFVLLRPNFNSWLVRGAYLITVFGALTGLWCVAGLIGGAAGLHNLLAWPMAALALATAGYTAMLFGQCKGRDFWQSPGLLLHMLNHAPLAGFAFLALIGKPVQLPLALFLIVSLLVIVAEVWGSHANADSAATAKDLRSGRAGVLLWCDVIGVGHLAPLLLLLFSGRLYSILAAMMVFVGMAVTEYLWVYLPQKRSNS